MVTKPSILRSTLFAVLALAGSVQAQQNASPNDSLGIARSGPFLALSVGDLERQVAWYRDTRGFTVYSQGVARDGAVHFALLQLGNSLLELLQLAEARPLKDIAPALEGGWLIHGFFKSGFVVSDIDAAYARVRRLGVTIEYELGQPDGPYRSFGINDPEGNLLQFFGK
jgi:catechol 2,3-dioxygenase-like lactoylglutathione lyase family enzyme